jgi:geranylgeranylglycerol-phosphate geranylgeranyltransferase
MPSYMNTQDAVIRAAPSSGTTKIKGMIDSARLSTRLWFDLLAPAAMMLVASRGHVPAWQFAGVLIIAVLFHAAANYFNDLADTAVDRGSSETVRNQRALVSACVSRRDLQVAGWTMVAVTLAIAAFLPWPSVAVVAVILLLEIAYDFEPLHLSNRPLVLQVFWPVVWALLFALCAVAVHATGWHRGLPFLVFVAIFMGLGEGITQDVRDADNDRAGGRRTTPVVFGVPRTVTVAWVFQVISLPAWIWFAIVYPLPVAVAVVGGVTIVVWLGYFLSLVTSLRRRFDKTSARLVHVGPIIAFSIINTCAIVGVLGS